MSININSETACRKAYLNYHCYGNTMGISANEMGEITRVWQDRVSSWQNTVSNDENEYDFDDSDYNFAKTTGKQKAQDKTDYAGGKGDIVARGATDGVMGLGTSVIASGVADGALNSVASGMGEFLGKNLQIGSTASSGATAGKTAKASWIIAAPLAMATGIRYKADKPNKEQKEACDELLVEMGNQQSNLVAAQEEMAAMSEEIIALSDEANEANEEANEELEDQKTEYDMYRATYEALKAKVDAGETLTESEYALYQEVMLYMTEAGGIMTETQDETSEFVTEIYDDMGTYQEGYDYAAETMANVEGVTDFAESFDSATQTMCYVEMGAQTLNAASGAKAAVDAGKFAMKGGWMTAWAWAFSAMGATGAALSGIGANEQRKWAGDVGNEIAAREATQDFNAETTDIYTEEIDAYDGIMTGVEELELEIPEDVEAPEDTGIPQAATGTTPETDDTKKPKEEDK